MRTLTRPMFNMGGPIKQGVMHGIREPYKHGTRAALVGNPVYPKTGGREHHMAVKVLQYGIPRVLPHIKRAGSAFKNIFRGTPTGQVPGWSPLTTGQKIKSWFGSAPAGKYLAGSPEGRLLSGGAGWAGAAGKKIGSVLKGAAKSPLTVGAGAWYGVPWAGKKLFGGDDDAPDAVTGVMKPGGYPEGTGTGTGTGKGKELTDAQRKAFANKQRNERVQKYMDMMGYDRSKKTAIADALIDASKLVSDRGTLDRKNITGELINPAIQALSKRLDKPEQIREAVGLMATKAEIEKDLSKERDALKTELTKLQIEGAKESLEASRSFEGGLQAFLATRKGGIKKEELEQISRLLADKHGESFIKTDEETVVSDDGIYMIGDGIFRVTDGVEKQIA
jgi:hypothetical protein